MRRWQKWTLAAGLLLAPAVALTQTAVSPVRTFTCGSDEFASALSTAGVFTCTAADAVPAAANPTATAGTSAINGAATTYMRSDAAPAVATASTGTAGLAKLHNVPLSIGWVATVDPNNTSIAIINQASTISAIIGNVEVAVGAAATVSIRKAPSGTACASGTLLHSGSFNANGVAATNQTLTVTTSAISAGDRLCLETTNNSNWVSGTGIGTITVFLAPS